MTRPKLPNLVEAREIIADFHQMIRTKTIDAFSPWIIRASGSLVLSFANGVLKDKAAVRNAITSPWSNGQTEGQITSAAFTAVLKDRSIAISMDGKGAWRDNVFVERLWRSVKYEEVYLRAYASVAEARSSLEKYFAFYNTRRPHSALDGMKPDQAYFQPLQLPAAA